MHDKHQFAVGFLSQPLFADERCKNVDFLCSVSPAKFFNFNAMQLQFTFFVWFNIHSVIYRIVMGYCCYIVLMNQHKLQPFWCCEHRLCLSTN